MQIKTHHIQNYNHRFLLGKYNHNSCPHSCKKKIKKIITYQKYGKVESEIRHWNVQELKVSIYMLPNLIMVTVFLKIVTFNYFLKYQIIRWRYMIYWCLCKTEIVKWHILEKSALNHMLRTGINRRVFETRKVIYA